MAIRANRREVRAGVVKRAMLMLPATRNEYINSVPLILGVLKDLGIHATLNRVSSGLLKWLPLPRRPARAGRAVAAGG